MPAADPLAPVTGALEQLAARCTESVADLAPVPMELAFRDVVSCPFGDAQEGLADTALVGAFQSVDKNTRVLIGADPACVDAALEALLGSDGSEPADASRAPTRIGMRVAEAVFRHVLDALRPAMSGGKGPALELDGLETAEKLPAPARPDQLAFKATFDFSALGRAGELFVVLPQSALHGVGLAVVPGGGASQAGPGDAGWGERIEREVHRTEVTLQAVLDERELTLSEIAGLRVGQVLPLKATPRSNVRVICNDQTMFWCELGQAEGVYTLRIKDFPDQERELIDAITSR